MGKGSAPRPIKDRDQFGDNFDAIFRKGPKPKNEIMKEMRERRKNEGLVEVRKWVTPDQADKINQLLEGV